MKLKFCLFIYFKHRAVNILCAYVLFRGIKPLTSLYLVQLHVNKKPQKNNDTIVKLNNYEKQTIEAVEKLDRR